jgi:copper transport protein
LTVGIASTVAGFLLQGPYAAGQSLTRALDPDLWADTMRTGFGLWTQLRLSLLLALAVILWPRGSLQSATMRSGAALGVVATAVTFSGTGHAADGGVWAHAVDSAHALLAGGWVGGLILLALTATDRENRPGLDALAAFSRFALLSVGGLLLTGILNSLLRLEALTALWDTGYGRTLSVKVAVLAIALAAAAWARTRVRQGAAPRSSIRVEAVSTVVVLALTAALASTAPSASAPPDAATSATPQRSTTVEMTLGEGRTALLHIDPPTTRGSSLHLELLDADGQPLDAAAAKLRATLPERELGPLEARLTGGPSAWTGDFSFPLPGQWELTLTVDEQGTGLVTAGAVRID